MLVFTDEKRFYYNGLNYNPFIWTNDKSKKKSFEVQLTKDFDKNSICVYRFAGYNRLIFLKVYETQFVHSYMPSQPLWTPVHPRGVLTLLRACGGHEPLVLLLTCLRVQCIVAPTKPMGLCGGMAPRRDLCSAHTQKGLSHNIVP